MFFIEIQVLDIGYYIDYDKNAIIKIFGNDKNGKSHIVDVIGFQSYFYVLTRPDSIDDVRYQLKDMHIDTEIVDRYRPIGFQAKPTKMIKVLVSNPNSIKYIKDEIRQSLTGVIDIYEADISFGNRFSADTGIVGMCWIDVPAQTVDYHDIKIIEEPREDAPLRILSIDIECLMREDGSFPEADKDQITLISFAFNRVFRNVKDLVIVAKDIKCERPDVISVSNEYELLKEFCEIVQQFGADILCGYNISQFDFPYLDERLRINNLNCNFGKDRSNWRIKDIAGKKDISVNGRIVLDLLPMVRKNFSLKEYKLKTVAKELLHSEKLDVEPKQMREYWFDEGEKFIDFVRYSRRDAILGMMLIQNLGMLQKYIALSKISGIMLQTVITGGQSVMLEFMLLQRFNRLNRVMAMKPQYSDSEEDDETQYQGAFVSEPEVGLHDHLLLTDFQSLYPSIIISNNLCPTTVIMNEKCSKTHFDPNGGEFADADICPGILPKMLDDVLKQRLAVKKQMKGLEGQERATLDAIQYALKIVINSAYGWTGYKRSRLFNLTTASAVTAYGRKTILDARDAIENLKNVEANGKLANLHVVYSDTDSAYVKVLSNDEITMDDADIIGNKIAEIVSAPMQYPMKLNYEGYARRAIFLAKKRYGMWRWEKSSDGSIKDKIKVSGIEIIRRDWCALTGNTMKSCLDLILKEGNVFDASKIVRDIIEKVRSFTLDDEEFLKGLVLTRNYHKGADSYSAKPAHIKMIERMKKRGDQLPGLGDRISYYIMSGREPFNERAETLEFIRKNGRNIDTEYYINKQLIPPLERIFTALKIDMMTGKKIRVACDLTNFGFNEVPVIENSVETDIKVAENKPIRRKKSLLDFCQ